MPSTKPTCSSAKPVLHRIDSSAASSNSHTPSSPTSSTSSSSPTTPRYTSSASSTTRHRLSLHNDSNIFSRIKPSSRSRSASVNRSNSAPTPTSSPTSSTSPLSSSPLTVDRRPRLHLRSDSAMSAGGSTTHPPRSCSQKRNSSGTVMQCGRHGNEWLFGGFSFTEAVRGLLSPTEGEDRSR